MGVSMVVSDPFVDDLQAHATRASNSSSNKQVNVRRPNYGFLVKEEMFASIAVKSVATADGKAEYISMFDSSAPGGMSNENHNFMLASIDLSFQEKAQVVQTFGQDYAFFHGQQPTILTAQGFLLDTRDFNWKNEFVLNYQKYLRGTACVRNKARVYLTFNSSSVSGYILSCQTSLTSDSQNAVPFGFTMLLTGYVEFSFMNPREITDTDDTGYTVKQEEGTRSIEYKNASSSYGQNEVIQKQTLYKYDPSKGMVVQMTAPGDSPPKTAAMDVLNSAWWIPNDEPKGSTEAFRELSIQQYMEENSVDRAAAFEAELQGKTLFNNPENLDLLKSTLQRSCQNALLVT